MDEEYATPRRKGPRSGFQTPPAVQPVPERFPNSVSNVFVRTLLVVARNPTPTVNSRSKNCRPNANEVTLRTYSFCLPSGPSSARISVLFNTPIPQGPY